MKLVKRKTILVDLDCAINAPLIRSTRGALGYHLDRFWGVVVDDSVLHCELIDSYTSGYVDRPHRLIWQILHADPDSYWFKEAEHPERLRRAVHELRKKFDASFIREDFSTFAIGQSSEGSFLITYSATTHSEEANYFLTCAGLGAAVRAIKIPGSMNSTLLEQLVRDLDIDAERSLLIAPAESGIVGEATSVGFRTALMKSYVTDVTNCPVTESVLDDYSEIRVS